MKAKGILKGKEIVLEKDLGIEGEIEVELDLILPQELEEEVFGIWRDREDIKDAVYWVRRLRDTEWQR